jgi:hypothetical protein
MQLQYRFLRIQVEAVSNASLGSQETTGAE